AGRARNVVARRLAAAQHAACIAHLFVVDAFDQAVGEGIAAEVAPEIPTVAENPSVPVDLRIVPQLMADSAGIFVAGLPLELCAGDRLPGGLRAHELGVA